jgi:23S rRNA (cytidine1920-2'-O)/16S rRNA (cytidine1409-2'-O)-methyltransferase
MPRRLLDQLCDQFPAMDREALLARVLSGEVVVDGEHIRDPSYQPEADAVIRIEAPARYVSRGGLKLEHALRAWNLPVEGMIYADAGSSTGGFTDCLLQHGARLVHAVDVGYNQLDYRLRRDERVIVHERTNIMHVDRLDPVPQAAVADLSFRSLRGAASHLLALVSEHWAVFLVKPQFEWADAPAGFDGVVAEEAIPAILAGTLRGLAEDGLPLCALERSPITGRKGNTEFLLLAGRGVERGVDELVESVL